MRRIIRQSELFRADPMRREARRHAESTRQRPPRPPADVDLPGDDTKGVHIRRLGQQALCDELRRPAVRCGEVQCSAAQAAMLSKGRQCAERSEQSLQTVYPRSATPQQRMPPRLTCTRRSPACACAGSRRCTPGSAQSRRPAAAAAFSNSAAGSCGKGSSAVSPVSSSLCVPPNRPPPLEHQGSPPSARPPWR